MLSDNLLAIQNSLPATVKLIAVSKFQPIEKLQEAYNAGQRAFGENRPQELRDKQLLMPDDVEWHFIGTLQSNKIKYVVPKTFLIHSIDTPELLIGVNKEAKKVGRVVDCLLEFHIAQEDTKQGFSLEAAVNFLNSDEFKSLENVRLKGVMGMASFIDNEDVVRDEFREFYRCFNVMKEKFYPTDDSFKELSMGMSGDYKLAIEEGSTMVRIGTSIFGARNYS